MNNFEKVCNKIIIEHQLFNEDYEQRVKNFDEFDWTSPFKSSEYPSKAIRRFIQSNGMYKLEDKKYLCLLIDSEHIDSVIYFEQMYGTVERNIKVDDLDENTKIECVNKYNELLNEVTGYYLTMTLPKALNPASKTLNESIFSKPIEFVLVNGKTNKSKKWVCDVNAKTTSQEIADWINNKLDKFGLELNDRTPYPEEVLKYPMILFFAFGRNNAPTVVEQFNHFGIKLEVIKNDENINIGITHKSEKPKPKRSITNTDLDITNTKNSNVDDDTYNTNTITRPRRRGKDVNMSISEIYALKNKYKFSKKHNNTFEKKQDGYIIAFRINKDDMLNEKLDHGNIEFGVSKDGSEYVDFGEDKLWTKEDTVIDIVDYIEQNIRKIFSDESFELKR